MSQKVWRCAVVGMGAAGESHLRALGTLERTRLVAACDVDEGVARAALDRQRASATIYTRLDELLAREEVDVVIVATPSGEHATAALAAFDRGAHVICEKPLDISLERIDAMIAAAARAGLRLGGVYQLRFNPIFRAIRRAVADGRLGAPVWAGAFVLWNRDARYYATWRGTKQLDGGGAILNNAIHSLDLLQWLAGPIATVSAHAANRVHALEVEDSLACAMRFASGALGSLVGTTAAFAGAPARLELVGADGVVVADRELRRVELRDGGSLDVAPAPVDFLAANLAHVLDSWAAERESEVDGAECRKAVAIALAMYESAARGGAPAEVAR